MTQRVLVTAGASGIGREIVRAFAAQGAKVFVCDIDGPGLDSLAKEIPGLKSKDGFVPESYCPIPISASTPESFFGKQPVLKRPNSGELIDDYGSCGETPVGQDRRAPQDLRRPCL